MPSCCVFPWPVCCACVWRGREPSSSCEGANSVMKPLLSWLHLSLITFQKPHLQTPLCWASQTFRPCYNSSPSLRHQAMAASFAECFLIYTSRTIMGLLWGTSPCPQSGPPVLYRSLSFCFFSSGSTRSHNGFCVIWRAPQPQLSLALEPCFLLWCDFLWTIVLLSSRLGVPHTLFPSEQPLQPHQLSQNHLM